MPPADDRLPPFLPAAERTPIPGDALPPFAPVDHDPFNVGASDALPGATAPLARAQSFVDFWKDWGEKFGAAFKQGFQGAGQAGLQSFEEALAQQYRPPGAVGVNDAGEWTDAQGMPLAATRRPTILPLTRSAQTGEAELAMPSILDVANTLGSPARAAAGTVTLGAGLTLPPKAAAKPAPVFYSAVENAVESLPLKSGTPEQWLGTIQNAKGVKKEELDWLGIGDWLKEQKGPVTKDQVADFVRQNKVELKEVDRRGSNFDPDNITNAEVREYHDISENTWEMLRPHEEAQLRAEYIRDLSGGSEPTRYAEYQMPGGFNYRELLLTLPTEKGGVPTVSEYNGRYYLNWPNGDPVVSNTTNTPVNYYSQGDAQRAARSYGRHNQGGFVSEHWDEPNVLAHVRVNERQLPRARTAEEVAAADAHAAAKPELDRLHAEQTRVAKEIQRESGPYQEMRDAAIRENLRTGKITMAEARRQLETYEPNPAIKPLQDEMRSLRAQEDAIRAKLPPEPKPAQDRTLFIEEIQSDWHQKGRKHGYRGDIARLDAEYRSALEAANQYAVGTPEYEAGYRHASQLAERLTAAKSGGVPDAPLKKTWHEMALKRMIREASEKGYDQIAWTPGEVQAARYDLSKQVDSIDVIPGEKPNTFMVTAKPRGSRQMVDVGNGDIPADKLADYVGKDLADKIVKDFKQISLENSYRSYTGDNLKVGGEGMVGFYDKILVDAANKIAKPFGSKVEKGNAPSGDKWDFAQHFDLRPAGSRWKLFDKKTGKQVGPDSGFGNGSAAEKWLNENGYAPKQEVHVLKITPAMREAAIGKGFPLFAKAKPPTGAGGRERDQEPVQLMPVDFDPFTAGAPSSGVLPEGAKPKRTWADSPVAGIGRLLAQRGGFAGVRLEPVDHDPFTGAR